jgi:hypothetical protein
MPDFTVISASLTGTLPNFIGRFFHQQSFIAMHQINRLQALL